MPFSSTDIASLTGGFSQQVLMQQQQAQMITNQFGGYSPSPYMHPVSSQGEQYSGALMNQMGSMGMSAMSSQRLNQFGGGIAAPFTQTGQFMMGQMAYGAQQQQMLDVNMRQSYRFPNSFGGRGFTQNDTALIGSSLRQMSHQRGPGGEMASFEELGQLASNMGRMGMAEGVRSVKDFNEKFKQMLNSVKTIATELGTSLEEAQKVMASMKGSGIFRNQGQFAGAIRSGALAGNMSTAEMSSAALMGAQISRSIGGLGRSGAYAGINTLSNIGAATQSGVMSEEDIYNTTGLTGAEGRQAMAQNMMGIDARFFSGKLGRRVLASIAGKGGSVNHDDVMSYMAGGVGTGDTMGMAHRNLGKIGRADFIRNEGRLRGEAMREFGGLGAAVVARNWLQGRGMDMNEMDDRSMLFFQRKFNVGRDEADNIIKMARNLDTIMAQRQNSAENDRYMKNLDQADRGAKPEEIAKRLEMARNEVNDGLRELGASFYKSMSTSINEFVGKLSGEYVQQRRAAMAGIVGKLMRGGPGASDIAERELGLVRGANGRIGEVGMSSSGQHAHRSLFGSGELSGMQFNRLIGANANRYREAGYDITGVKSQGELSALQQRIFQGSSGFAEGGSGLRVGADGDALRAAMANGALQGSGDDFAKNFGSMLGGLHSESGRALAASFNKAGAAERGKMMRDILDQTGMTDSIGYDRMSGPEMLGARGSLSATVEDENRRIGNMILGSRSRYGAAGGPSLEKRVRGMGTDLGLLWGGNESMAGRAVGAVTDVVGGAAGGIDSYLRQYTAGTPQGAANRGVLAGAVTSLPRSMVSEAQGALDNVLGRVGLGSTRDIVGDVGKNLAGLTGGLENLVGGQIKGMLGEYSDQEKQGVAEYLKSDEGRSLAGQMLGPDSGQALDSVQKRRAKLSNMKNRSATENAEMEGLRSLEAMGRVRALGGKPSQKQLQDLAKQMDFKDVESMLQAAGGAEATSFEERRRGRAQAFEGIGRQARDDSAATAEADKDVQSRIASGDLKIGDGAKAYLDKMNELRKLQTGFTGDSSAAGDAANQERYDKMDGMQSEMAKLRTRGSVKDRKQMAKDLIAAGRGSEGSRMLAEINAEERLVKGRHRASEGGVTEAVAGALGVDFKKGDFKGLKGGAAVNELMNRMGLGEGSTVQNRDQISKELNSILNDKGLSNAQKGQKLADLQGRSEIVQGQRAAQDKKAEGNDPGFRRLGEIKEELGKVAVAIKGVTTRLGQPLEVKEIKE